MNILWSAKSNGWRIELRVRNNIKKYLIHIKKKKQCYLQKKKYLIIFVCLKKKGYKKWYLTINIIRNITIKITYA